MKIKLLGAVVLSLFLGVVYSSHLSYLEVKNVQAQTPATITICLTGTAGSNGCNYIGTAGIQTGINAANSGDTVMIKSGTYYNTNLRIGVSGNPAKTGITIKGEAGTVLSGLQLAGSSIKKGNTHFSW